MQVLVTECHRMRCAFPPSLAAVNICLRSIAAKTILVADLVKFASLDRHALFAGLLALQNSFAKTPCFGTFLRHTSGRLTASVRFCGGTGRERTVRFRAECATKPTRGRSCFLIQSVRNPGRQRWTQSATAQIGVRRAILRWRGGPTVHTVPNGLSPAANRRQMLPTMS